MIQIKQNEKGMELEISGTTAEIATDFCFAIRQTYLAMQKRDEKEAEVFKKVFETVINEGIVFSDIEEVERKVDELVGKKETNCNKLDKIIEKLDEINEMLDEFDDDCKVDGEA